MATQFGPRKQRTRQHVIADQSIHHVEGFVLDEGHTVERTVKDYGIDLLLFTFDEHGYIEPGMVMLQVKASESLQLVDSEYAWDLDVRDYNLWMSDPLPVIVVLYDANRRRGYWSHVQRYFHENVDRRPKDGARSVRLRISSRQKMNRKAIAKIREIKSRPELRLFGEP
jgi:hypothetical protein